MAGKKKKKLFSSATIVAIIIIIAILFLGKRELDRIEETTQEALQDQSQDTGKEEPVEEPSVQTFSDDINVDIISRHDLPKLARMESKDRKYLVESLQVMKKYRKLHLSEDVLLHPERSYQQTKKNIDKNIEREDSNRETVKFTGTSGNDLQSCINANRGKTIVIESDVVQLSQGIDIPGNTQIQGLDTTIECRGIVYAFKGENVSDIGLDALKIRGTCDYGVVLSKVKNCWISNCDVEGMIQKAIVIEDASRHVRLSDNVIRYNKAGGIYVSEGSSYIEIKGNDISDNKGTSNWMAGVVLTTAHSNDVLYIWEPFNSKRRFPKKSNLYLDIQCPNHIVIENNRIADNHSSGIYSDGAVESYIQDNRIYGNDKEGLCLDYGTIGFYLYSNCFDGNGYRRHQSDEDLKMDHVMKYGRQQDGSATAKLPGISIDNAAYNIINCNIVVNNAGGGVKMVRTGVRNLIMENLIKDNNDENGVLHFFGVEAGSATADTDDTDMDFTPSYENIICRNVISGRHWSGVFIGEDGYANDVFDNSIMEPEFFMVESISKEFNSIVNNVSNMPVRDEYKRE